MSTVSVTNLKHESASGNNITLDSSGRTILGGKLAVGSGVTPATALHAQSSSSEADRSLRLAYDGTYYSEIRQLGAGGMAFRNNNTNDLLKIDGSGRVTTPYQPAFNAYFTTDFSLSYGEGTIAYNSVSYNIGSHYNQSTGRFTAPVAGLYWLMHKLATNAAIPYEAKIYKNASEIIRSYEPNTSSNTKTVIATSVVYLNAGDYVTADRWQSNGSPQTFFGSTVPNIQSHFSGYLIG